MKHLLAAKACLEMALTSFERGDHCLAVIKLLKKSQEQIQQASAFILTKHLTECLEKTNQSLINEEIIKSYKYRQA